MADSFHAVLDRFFRRHPRLTLAATIALGIATTLILVYNTKETAIVYEAF
jgi:hypothetical protein